MGIFHVFFYLSVIDIPLTVKTKLKYVKMTLTISSKLTLKKNINSVHNLITFSIVFTNKNWWGFDSKLGLLNISSKLRLKRINYHILFSSSPPRDPPHVFTLSGVIRVFFNDRNHMSKEACPFLYIENMTTNE